MPAEKRRKDLRLRGRAGAELDFDEEGAFRATLDYTLLDSISNMDPDPDDPEHEYDYADRNFVQQVVEVGVQASF